MEDKNGSESGRFKFIKIQIVLDLYLMKPDYPHKIFNDKRCNYNLLMEVLAMDGISLYRKTHFSF
jgi:hypothetical protein